MENEKYYIPDVDDFYVGYQCQAAQIKNPTVEEHWYNTRIVEDDLKKCYPRNFGHNDTYKIWDFPIRTPFLTREQIENEGWIFTGEFVYTDGKTEYRFERGKEYVNKYVLNFFNDDYYFQIGKGSFYPEELLIKGYCKSINEYRKIIKLLGIDGK